MSQKIKIRFHAKSFSLYILLSMLILSIFPGNVNAFNNGADLDINSEFKCTHLSYYSNSLLILLKDEGEVISSDCKITYDFFSNESTNKVNDFVQIKVYARKLSNHKEFLNIKDIFPYNASTNIISYRNNSVLGNFHLFKDPSQLDIPCENFEIANYNNHSVRGKLELNKTLFQTYILNNDKYFVNYTKISLNAYQRNNYIESNGTRVLLYERNSGVLIQQSPYFLGLDLYSFSNIKFAGGFYFELIECDYPFISIELPPRNDGGLMKLFYASGIILLVGIIGASSYFAYRIIFQKRINN